MQHHFPVEGQGNVDDWRVVLHIFLTVLTNGWLLIFFSLGLTPPTS